MNKIYKKRIYFFILGLIIFSFLYRFYMVFYERHMKIFNIDRNNKKNGVPVEVLQIKKEQKVLYKPLAIQNNKAYVSKAQIENYKVGQSVGNCRIISVSHNIDLNTGMYVIRTKGCKNGLNKLEINEFGYFVPIYAIDSDFVFLVQENTAKRQKIFIKDRDKDNALVVGLNDGDMIILSNIEENQKIKI